jgi:hypothetical protein
LPPICPWEKEWVPNWKTGEPEKLNGPWQATDKGEVGGMTIAAVGAMVDRHSFDTH